MKIIGTINRGLSLFASVFVGISLLFISMIFIFRNTEIQSTYVPYHARPQIILDAGHGGMDGGAVGINGVIEKEINLSICLKLAELLRQNGFEIILTRSTDASIHDPEENSIASQKRSDMYNRKAIIDSFPNAVFLSVHQNTFSDSSCSGAQVFHSPNHSASSTLAQNLQDNLRENLQPDNSRQIKVAGDNLFLLYTAKTPAVMVECGFLSNREECEQLCDENYQKKIAYAIYLSLLDFFSGQ